MTIKGSVMSLALVAAVVVPVAVSANEAEAACYGHCYFVTVCVAPGHYVDRIVLDRVIRHDPCGRPHVVIVERVVSTWVPPVYVSRCIRCGCTRPTMPRRRY